MKSFWLSIFASLIAGCMPVSADVMTGTYTTGGATTGAGPYTLTSTDSTYSVLRFVVNETFTFADTTNINVDYDAIQGGIGGGTPRAVVVFTDLTSLLIHFGPAGSFVDPALGSGKNSGNLISMLDWGRYDLGGVGGSAYSDYADALSLAGTKTIDRVSLIVDSYGGNDREFNVSAINVEANVGAVPEPSSIALFATAMGLAAFMRRRRSARC